MKAVEELATLDKKIKLTGFDIAAPQLHRDNNIQSATYTLHDVISPFPAAISYHRSVDLIHIRLLTYALKVEDEMKAVGNIISILRRAQVQPIFLSLPNTDISLIII